MLVACGSSSPPPSTPANHAAATDCAITGQVISLDTHEPRKGVLVLLIGPGMPREQQHTDEAGRFTFPHSAGRTKVNAYSGHQSVEHPIQGCGEVKLELPPPENVIEI